MFILIDGQSFSSISNGPNCLGRPVVHVSSMGSLETIDRRRGEKKSCEPPYACIGLI
jgi:hypothetical protein